MSRAVVKRNCHIHRRVYLDGCNPLTVKYIHRMRRYAYHTSVAKLQQLPDAIVAQSVVAVERIKISLVVSGRGVVEGEYYDCNQRKYFHNLDAKI